MKKIRLAKSKIYALIDDEDYRWLKKYPWHITVYGYASTTIKIGGIYKHKLMHRMILNTPKGMDSDHINGNKLDNRRKNLRIATRTQNLLNSFTKIRNITGYRGVRLTKTGIKRKWRYIAYFHINNKAIYIGAFVTRPQAALAYNKVAREKLGKFAKLNVLYKMEKKKRVGYSFL